MSLYLRGNSNLTVSNFCLGYLLFWSFRFHPKSLEVFRTLHKFKANYTLHAYRQSFHRNISFFIVVVFKRSDVTIMNGGPLCLGSFIKLFYVEWSFTVNNLCNFGQANLEVSWGITWKREIIESRVKKELFKLNL